MSDLVDRIAEDLKKQIEDYEPSLEVRDIGYVQEGGDGIALVGGLSDVRAQELVRFENGVMGIAFNLEDDNVRVSKSMIKAYFNPKAAINSLGEVQEKEWYWVVISGRYMSGKPFGAQQKIIIVK